MIQTIKNNAVVLIAGIILSLGVSVALPSITSAQAPPVVPPSTLQQGVNCGSKLELKNDSTCNAKPADADTSVSELIKRIINIFSAIVGAVSVIMIIVGGFRYITSGGDSNNVGGAKNTILYAIVGLIIVAFAQIIVRFVLQSSLT